MLRPEGAQDGSPRAASHDGIGVDPDEPIFARSSGRVHHEHWKRAGNPGADPATVRDALPGAEADRQLADLERNRAAEEQAEAHRLLEHPDRVDARAERQHDERTPTDEAAELRDRAVGEWDSAERREADASSLEGTASKESIDAWKQADSDHAKHPREAVRRAGGSTPKARKTRAGGDREMQRGPRPIGSAELTTAIRDRLHGELETRSSRPYRRRARAVLDARQ